MTAPRVCRSCHGPDLHLVIDLGSQPASDSFPAVDDPAPDPCWPLSAWYCASCHLVQLSRDAAPDPEQPRAVESRTMLAAAATSAARLVADLRLGPGDSVVEFDSHHGGSWLQHLLAAGLVEGGPDDLADVVVDVHGVAHEDDLAVALADRASRLAPSGHLVLVFHHLLPLVQESQFDTVRHGHPLYLSLLALVPALARHGLQPVDARAESAYGGSLVVTAGHDGPVAATVQGVLDAELAAGLADPVVLAGLQHRADASAAALHRWLTEAAHAGRKVVGYGAPSKASVLLTHSGVTPELLPFTADLSPDKQGRRIPGARVPIVSPEHLLAAAPDDVLVLTWDILDEVREQLHEVGDRGGRFVVPVPELRVHGGA